MRDTRQAVNIFIAAILFLCLIIVALCSCATTRGSGDGPTTMRHKYSDAEMAVIWKKLSRCDKWPAKCKRRIKAAEKIACVKCKSDLNKQKAKNDTLTTKLARYKKMRPQKQAQPTNWLLIAVPAYLGGMVTVAVIALVVWKVAPQKPLTSNLSHVW